MTLNLVLTSTDTDTVHHINHIDCFDTPALLEDIGICPDSNNFINR